MAATEPIEWMANAGGQIDADSHGDVNLGVRRGPWGAVLRTDALELRWGPSADRWRAWVSVSGHGFAAQMFISPWTDGAPDPDRAFSAASVSEDAGWIGYGPAGTWAGGRIAGSYVVPYANDVPGVPDSWTVGTFDALAGWHRPWIDAWGRAGIDLELFERTGDLSPHAVGEVHLSPPWKVGALALAPRVELWAGVASGQDELLRTRLGGLNPWVVPLAGAAWAEWWVEDYAVLRVGPTVGVGDPGALGVRVSPFVDQARFDGQDATGFGVAVRAWRGRLFADATAGVAPWIPRQDGVGRASVWFQVGWDWGTAAGPASTERPPGPEASKWP